MRDIILPLGPLSVVTGAGGTGKSSIYKALRLLADVADDRIIESIAQEGGFDSVLWAGPESISKAMRDGSVPIQGTVRRDRVALKLGFADEDIAYAIELGLPGQDSTSLFNRDPEIKRETLWTGLKPTPSKIIADRHGPRMAAKRGAKTANHSAISVASHQSMIREFVGAHAPWEVSVLRQKLSAWRFYDHMRTDTSAPSRGAQIGTRTVALSVDGGNIAAAIQTIYEIGDGSVLDAAIDTAFPGARLKVTGADGVFRLSMQQRGMLRPLNAAELSDGTLRFIMLAAALLSPRPAPLLVLNEPESSLHSSTLPALASLIVTASQDSQLVVVSHNRLLVTSLLDSDAELIELYKDAGETFVQGDDLSRWHWPKR
ncbi:MAG: AAA family ATPase [Pseudomonadota bacterium]